jgi:replicative DNA helicase
MGIKADLVLIDYVDLLSSRKKNRERKDEIDDIYTSTKGLARQLNIPIWSVSQVNRAGAQDKIIEGDKAAGSYDKMMISDFAMSLSRKKEDKVNNTGRFHIMKNRYGMDGLTFSVSADVSTGHFEVYDYKDDQENEPLQPSSRSNKFDTDVDTFDKQLLHKKFIELEK